MTSILSPKGRVSSRDYFSISIALKALLIACIYGILSDDVRVVFLLGLAAIPIFYIIMVYTIKRLHDLDLSGWWSVFIIVAPLNIGFIPYLWFKRGNPETNQYGKNPYSID